jgi:hypothetical protein
MESLNLRFTLDRCADIEDLLESDSIDSVQSIDDTFVVVVTDADETLVESLNPDELAEFYGIDSEFLIAVEVED